MSAQDSPPPEVMLDDMLCFAIYAASHAFTRFYKPLLDGLGLTYPQFLVIVALGQADQQTVGQIGARLMLDSGTRRRDGRDERQVRIGLTEAGRDALAQSHGIHSCVADALGRDMGALRGLKAEVDQLRTALSASA
jgi:DNA-binding MarR family transcriptional regulator